MDIKIPKIRVVRQQHVESVMEDMVKMILKVNFWVGFLGWYKVYEVLKMKGWLG
jgi:hypothetical protein